MPLRDLYDQENTYESRKKRNGFSLEYTKSTYKFVHFLHLFTEFVVLGLQKELTPNVPLNKVPTTSVIWSSDKTSKINHR